MKIGSWEIPVLYLLLPAFPVAAVLYFTGANEIWVFVTACVSIIPLAGMMGKATEHLAETMGAAVGGLLNATFGNAAELIIALLALHKGLHDVVKASLTGSIIGNSLLVLGLSILAGGLRFRTQKFNKTAAGLGATLLALSAVGLVVPALFHLLDHGEHPVREHNLSLLICVVLFVTYGLSLLFSLKTHQNLFGGGHGDDDDAGHVVGEVWSRKKSITVLIVATALVGVAAEFLVASVETVGEAWGLSHMFIGVVLVAIVGNAAEHSTAILVAMKNRMDLSIHIAVGSSIQIALFVAPVLVFMSYAFGNPMDLDFTVFEVVAVGLSVGIVALVAHDGECHWMEGVLLLAVYIILGLAFFYLPETSEDAHSWLASPVTDWSLA